MEEAPPAAQSENPASDEGVGKKILAGGTWRMIAYAFSSVLGVVMTAVVSRELGPSDFALFITAMSLVTIALSLSDAGLLALGIREYASKPESERDHSQRVLIGLRLITALITSCGIVAFAVLKAYPSDVIIGLVAAGVGICGLSLCISYSVPLQATFRLGQVAALEAGRQALQMTLMIAFAIAFANVGWLLAAILPTGVVLAVAAGIMSRKLSPITPSFDFVEMRKLLVAAGAFAVTAAIGSNYAFVAQIVSDSAMNAHESGMFSLAFRVFIVGLAVFVAGVGGAFALLVSAVTENDRNRLAFASRRLSQSALLAGFGAATAFVTGAGFIVDLLGGKEFADAVPVVAVVGLAFPGSYLVAVANLHLLADKQFKALIVRAASGALCSVIATALLAKQFGAVGAAGGIIVGEYALAVLYVSKTRSVDAHSVPRLRWVLGAVLAGGGACLVALLPLPSVVNAMIGGAVYLLLVLVFKLVPPELLHPVKSRLGFAV